MSLQHPNLRVLLLRDFHLVYLINSCAYERIYIFTGTIIHYLSIGASQCDDRW